MSRTLCLRVAAAAVICVGLGGASVHAAEAWRALEARNPLLADLKKRDPKLFEAAVSIIERQEREKGFDPETAAPPTEPVERGMGPDAARDLAKGNPDILWLYNASPEGMNDLISLMKTAGQRPKS